MDGEEKPGFVSIIRYGLNILSSLWERFCVFTKGPAAFPFRVLVSSFMIRSQCTIPIEHITRQAQGRGNYQLPVPGG
jgi:hypothetical protein